MSTVTVARRSNSVRLLIRVRAQLAQSASWTQQVGARMGSGGPACSPRDPMATCWCLTVAIQLLAHNDHDSNKARMMLEDLLYGRELYDWNDDPSRTHAQVLSLLDLAIAGKVRD